VTRHAAQALGLAATHGTIEVGKVADLCVWNVEQPAALAYEIGSGALRARFKNGVQHPLQ